MPSGTRPRTVCNSEVSKESPSITKARLRIYMGCWQQGLGKEGQTEEKHLGCRMGRAGITHGCILRISQRHSPVQSSDCQFHTHQLTRMSLSDHDSRESKVWSGCHQLRSPGHGG